MSLPINVLSVPDRSVASSESKLVPLLCRKHYEPGDAFVLVLVRIARWGAFQVPNTGLHHARESALGPDSIFIGSNSRASARRCPDQ